MKTIPAGLQAHYDGGSKTVAYALRITRSDGTVLGFTSHDDDAIISGVTYEASGLDVSGIAGNAELAVDNLTATTLDDGTVFTRPAIIGGLWNNAAFLIFRYNWADLSDGVEYLTAGTLGNIEMKRGHIVVEMRGLQQYMQQPVGEVSTKTCRARLGDSRCTVALAPFTHSGTVTSAASTQVFTASAMAQATDYFAEGVITWSTGSNAGLQQKIKSFTSGGNFTLMLPMTSTIQIGDTFSAVIGCRKRLEDCRDIFNNVLNFQGEPHRPGLDELTASPDVSA